MNNIVSEGSIHTQYDYFIGGQDGIPLAFKEKGEEPVINDAKGAIASLVEQMVANSRVVKLYPQAIEVVEPKASYGVPIFEVTDQGLRQSDEGFTLNFCKGNKADPTAFRQAGFFTETLIAVCKKYLEDNNVGDLASRETAVAITKLDEALMWIGKRAADREARGVQGTYQK